jgi:hypothetical protein
MLPSFGRALLLSAFAIAGLAAAPNTVAQDQPTIYLRELSLMTPGELTLRRRNCAMHRMPQVFESVRRGSRKDAARAGFPVADLPPVPVYCLEALNVSARRNLLADLYMSLALQEQGISGFHFAEYAQLLRNDEAGRTTGSILRAANAGERSYVGLAGQSRTLPCPLALDAGYTWATRNPSRQMAEMTAEAASAVARQCYNPSTTRITLNGETMSAQRAGLLAGAWLARH